MPPITRSSTPLLGSVLVVGGTGFLGFHLVRRLLDDPECGPVYVLDINIERNQHDGAEYMKGSILDVEVVDWVIQKIKPQVIFHLASPNPTIPDPKEGALYETNVKGTEILLTSAASCDSVKAFVFTSTIDIYADPPHKNADETQPLWVPGSNTAEYGISKAVAEKIVLAANSPKLQTVSIVVSHLYGERCRQGTIAAVDVCHGPLFEVGDGKNLIEAISASNAVTAHVLAAKALLDPSRASGNIAGEAFIVSDGEPISFWHHMKLMWAVGRGKPVVDSELWHIPAWVGHFLAWIVAWAYWIFTFGTKKPPLTMSRVVACYFEYDHTYNTQKAKKRLRYEPVADHDAVLTKAIEWELERRKGLKGKK